RASEPSVIENGAHERWRKNRRVGLSLNVSFPLTPALSLRERETRFASVHRTRSGGSGRQCIVDGGNRDGRSSYLDHQLGIALVMQLNDNDVLRTVHVPKYAVTFLAKATGCDHAGKMRPQSPNAFARTFGNLRIGSNGFDVLDGNFQSTLEGPKFVPTLHFDDQLVLGYRYLRHIFPSSLPYAVKGTA